MSDKPTNLQKVLMRYPSNLKPVEVYKVASVEDKRLFLEAFVEERFQTIYRIQGELNGEVLMLMGLVHSFEK